VTQEHDDVFRLQTTGDQDSAEGNFRLRLGGGLGYSSVEALAEEETKVRQLLDNHPGFVPVITPEPLEQLVGAISAQQVNLTWAGTTYRRLVETLGTAHQAHGYPVWEFPSAETLAQAPHSLLREMQFTNSKAQYILNTAQFVAQGGLDGLDALSNDGVIDRLTSIKGIGRWTAEQFLARCLARPTAVASGDLGIRKAVSFVWFDSEELLPEEVVRDTAAQWGDAANWVGQLLLQEL
jgi:DNA-3-methyladenine glycosylase II